MTPTTTTTPRPASATSTTRNADVLNLILDPMAYGFMQRGLVAAVLVGIVCAVMGAFVVLRGLAFIGDAVSHAAFPGLVIAYLLGLPLYIGGGVAAVGTALAIGVVARRGALRFDTAVGVLFAGMFALGILLFSTIKGYVADLFGYLLGNVLGITFVDIIQIAFLGGVVLVVVAILRKELLYASFDPAGAAASGLPVERLDYLLLGLIGVTIVVSIQAVGIIMVVAMLVTPAATGQLLVSRFWDLVKVAIGVAVVASVAGLYLSFYFNVASGASIVLVETLLFTVALLFSPKSGWLLRRARPTTTALIVGPAQDT
jgi:manganese/iron transport system permease protein